MPRRRHPWLAAALAAALAGCAGPTAAHKGDLNAKIAARDWKAALDDIHEGRDSEYGGETSVLYLLDAAAVMHDAGYLRESDLVLDRAERRLDELYTRSISRAAGTFLVSDNTEEWRGEPHDRALLHVLRALNHAYLGQRDEAAVEARKVSLFLAELHDRYGVTLTHREDAFAHYLSALLFEDAGHPDDARISLAAARATYRAYQRAYGTPPPVLEPPTGFPGEGELVFLHYAGPAPRRQTRTLQVAWGEAMGIVRVSSERERDLVVRNASVAAAHPNVITVALPEPVQDPFRIQGSVVEAGGQRATTQLVEDVSAISRKALEERLPGIQARAVTRALLKLLLAQILEQEVRRQAGKDAGDAAGATGRAIAAAAELADTRCWSTLPAQIRMARLRLPPGRHRVQVTYLDGLGVPLAAEQLELTIAPGTRTWTHVRTVW
jgi:uncharacterized protein